MPTIYSKKKQGKVLEVGAKPDMSYNATTSEKLNVFKTALKRLETSFEKEQGSKYPDEKRIERIQDKINEVKLSIKNLESRQQKGM